jgi:hypothetical protein
MAIVIFSAMNIDAQDFIIKNDKSEIKSKIVEITENTIKYKKWEFLDGPLYNIAKGEVFMLIYANGQREIIQQSNKHESDNAVISEITNNPANTNNVKKSTQADQLNQMTKSANDTIEDYKNTKVGYKPRRIMLGMQSPISIGFGTEFRIIKNAINLGTDVIYTFPKDKDILSSEFGFIYAGLYAPINRLSGNYKNQDKGLFIFGHVGYGITSLSMLDMNGDQQTINTGSFTWSCGADCMISNDFGINVTTYQFNSYYAGIVVLF